MFTIGGIQIALAILFFSVLPLWKKDATPSADVILKRPVISPRAPELTMKSPAPYLAAAVFFVYMGVETGVGTWLKTLLFEYRGVSNTLAGVAVSAYYFSIMAGRMFFGMFSDRIGSLRTMRIGMVFALVGAGMLFAKNIYVTIPAVICLGGGLSPIFPVMMHENPRRFNSKIASKTMGIQEACVFAGHLFLTPVIGVIGAHTTMEAVVIWAAVLLVADCILIETLNFLTRDRIRIVPVIKDTGNDALANEQDKVLAESDETSYNECN
jgi:fucose permease